MRCYEWFVQVASFVHLTSNTSAFFFAILSEQISRSIAGHFSLAELSWKFLIVIVDWGFWFSYRSRFCMWNPGVGILTCSLRHVRPRSMAMSCESSFPSLRRRAGSMPWLPAYFWIYNMSTCCVARCRHRSAWAKVTQNVICHVSLLVVACQLAVNLILPASRLEAKLLIRDTPYLTWACNLIPLLPCASAHKSRVFTCANFPWPCAQNA